MAATAPPPQPHSGRLPARYLTPPEINQQALVVRIVAQQFVTDLDQSVHLFLAQLEAGRDLVEDQSRYGSSPGASDTINITR